MTSHYNSGTNKITLELSPEELFLLIIFAGESILGHTNTILLLLLSAYPDHIAESHKQILTEGGNIDPMLISLITTLSEVPHLQKDSPLFKQEVHTMLLSILAK